MENQEPKEIDNFIVDLKSSNCFNTLIPGVKQETFKASVQFESYSHLIYTVRDLLKVAVHTIENNGSENSGTIEYPSNHVTTVLELALQFLPCSECEGLDLLQQLYLTLQHTEDHENQS